MRRWLVVVVLALSAGVVLADRSSVSKYASESGKFSIDFPTRPNKTDSDKSLATASGNVTVVTSKAEKDGLVFSVTFVNYPDSFASVSASRVLDGVIDGMKGNDGQVSAISSFDEAGGSGRLATITAGENVVKVKTILVGTRLYLVQVCGKKDAMRARTTDEFLSSFRLTK